MQICRAVDSEDAETEAVEEAVVEGNVDAEDVGITEAGQLYEDLTDLMPSTVPTPILEGQEVCPHTPSSPIRSSHNPSTGTILCRE